MPDKHDIYSLYSSHKTVLVELVEEARTHYLQASLSRVTLHMTDGVRLPHPDIRYETYPNFLPFLVFVDQNNHEISQGSIYINSSRRYQGESPGRFERISG
jgi:hypothetical protein